MNYSVALETLGLKKGFKPEDLTKAYRALAKKLHPDRYLVSDEEMFHKNEEKLKKVNEARDYLEKHKEVKPEVLDYISKRYNSFLAMFQDSQDLINEVYENASYRGYIDSLMTLAREVRDRLRKVTTKEDADKIFRGALVSVNSIYKNFAIRFLTINRVPYGMNIKLKANFKDFWMQLEEVREEHVKSEYLNIVKPLVLEDRRLADFMSDLALKALATAKKRGYKQNKKIGEMLGVRAGLIANNNKLILNQTASLKREIASLLDGKNISVIDRFMAIYFNRGKYKDEIKCLYLVNKIESEYNVFNGQEIWLRLQHLEKFVNTTRNESLRRAASNRVRESLDIGSLRAELMTLKEKLSGILQVQANGSRVQVARARKVPSSI